MKRSRRPSTVKKGPEPRCHREHGPAARARKVGWRRLPLCRLGRWWLHEREDSFSSSTLFRIHSSYSFPTSLGRVQSSKIDTPASRRRSLLPSHSLGNVGIVATGIRYLRFQSACAAGCTTARTLSDETAIIRSTWSRRYCEVPWHLLYDTLYRTKPTSPDTKSQEIATLSPAPYI